MIFRKSHVAILLWCAVCTAQAQSLLVSGGTAGNYTINYPANITILPQGIMFTFKANHANPGAGTINLNGLGPVPLKKNFNQDLSANDILTDYFVTVIYDGTNWQMLAASVYPVSGGANPWMSNPGPGIHYMGGVVGINTTTPGFLLDVNGDIRATDNIRTDKDYLINGSSVLKFPLNSVTSSIYVGGAGNSTSDGIQNVLVGQSAGASMTSGYGNNFIGYAAGNQNTTGQNNVFIGQYSGSNNISGNSNVFIGDSAGSQLSNAVSGMVFIGSNAGSQSNPTFGGNTYIGHSAGSNNTSGNYNTYLGAQAGASNATGSHNVLVGFGAGFALAAGSSNVMIGKNAGSNTNSGSQNIIIGQNAGMYNTGGSRNVLIGHNSNVGAAGLINAIAIGNNASVANSNQMVLGGTGADVVNVGIGTNNPTLARLQVFGGVNNTGAVFQTGNRGVAFYGLNDPAIGFNMHEGAASNLVSIGTQRTAEIRQDITNDGIKINFSNVPAGLAGATMTMTQRLFLKATGELLLGSGNTTFGRLAVRGTFNKGAVGAENVFNLVTADAVSPMEYRFGMYTDATAINRHGYIEVDDAGTKRDLALAPAGGNVGIGTTQPSTLLAVQGAITVDQGGVNDGTYNSFVKTALRFGSLVGEGITSKKTAGGNQFGLDFWTDKVNRMSITSAGNVGIGTSTPSVPLQIERSGGKSEINMHSFGSTSATDPYSALVLARARNTQTTPQAVTTNDVLGAVVFRGHTGSGWQTNASQIRADATENFSATNGGSRLIFSTVQNGTATASPRMYVDHSGNVSFGDFIATSRVGIDGNMAIGAAYRTFAAPANGAIIQGDVGIGLSNPIYPLHVASTSTIAGETAIYGILNSSANSGNNTGISGEISSTGTSGNAIGVFGRSTTTGLGAYAVGVYGTAIATGGTADATGVWGEANSTAGTKPNYGVCGRAFGSPSANYGITGITSGAGGTNNYGGYFQANASGTNNYGLYVTVAGTATNRYAGVFWGGGVGIGTVPGANTQLHVAGSTEANIKMQALTAINTSAAGIGGIDFMDNRTSTPQANIKVIRDGTGATNDYPTGFEFGVTADGTAGPIVTALKISNNRDVSAKGQLITSFYSSSIAATSQPGNGTYTPIGFSAAPATVTSFPIYIPVGTTNLRLRIVMRNATNAYSGLIVRVNVGGVFSTPWNVGIANPNTLYNSSDITIAAPPTGWTTFQLEWQQSGIILGNANYFGMVMYID